MLEGWKELSPTCDCLDPQRIMFTSDTRVKVKVEGRFCGEGRDLTELMRRLLSSKTSSFTRTNMELFEEVAVDWVGCVGQVHQAWISKQRHEINIFHQLVSKLAGRGRENGGTPVQ